MLYLTEASTFKIILILLLNIIKLTVKIEYEEIRGKCYPKILNHLCHDSFEVIEIIFNETAFLTVSETPQMEILVHKMQP